MVPRRQLIRRQSAPASMASAGAGLSLGTGCLRGLPVRAAGQSSSTAAGYTFCTFGTPTAQDSSRSLKPCRKAALIP